MRFFQVPFISVVKIMFLLGVLVFMVTLTEFWHRLSKILLLDCHGLQPLRGVAKPGLRLQLNVKNWSVLDSGGTLQTKKPHFEPKYGGHQNSMKSSSLQLEITTDPKKKGSNGECLS